MALGDVLKRVATPTVLAGIGLAVATPLLLRGLRAGGRPVAKALIHKYFDAADKLQEASAESRERWRDLLAEVRAERASEAGGDAEGALPQA